MWTWVTLMPSMPGMSGSVSMNIVSKQGVPLHHDGEV